jgi:hypothetical protein
LRESGKDFGPDGEDFPVGAVGQGRRTRVFLGRFDQRQRGSVDVRRSVVDKHPQGARYFFFISVPFCSVPSKSVFRWNSAGRCGWLRRKFGGLSGGFPDIERRSDERLQPGFCARSVAFADPIAEPVVLMLELGIPSSDSLLRDNAVVKPAVVASHKKAKSLLPDLEPFLDDAAVSSQVGELDIVVRKAAGWNLVPCSTPQ